MSLKLGANFRPTENSMVLCNEYGQPLSQSSPNRRYERILKAAGVRYKKFHCTRHTYASKRIQSGHDIATVSRALGHSKTQTTLNTYVHATADIF